MTKDAAGLLIGDVIEGTDGNIVGEGEVLAEGFVNGIWVGN